MFAKLVVTGLRRIGFHVTRFPPPHIIWRQVKDFFRDNQINLVLDVGAFQGTYCKMLRKVVSYTGMIVSFEPCHESFRILSAEMAKDRQWQGCPFGLSDRDSAAVLNTFGERGDFNSLLRLRDEDAPAYGVDTGNASTEAIQLHTIDTIWDNIITKGIQAPRCFLKTDTQGHDPAVLLGAVNHLQYIYGVQSELPTVEIYDGMMSMAEALLLYRKLGYVPIGFYPGGTPEVYSGLVPEFDVILKRHV
jgi:FkbM family methyltransferase